MSGPRDAGNLALDWAAFFLGALADAGVRQVVTSPGARSLPFLLAAEASARFALHSVTDERAAAFFALGQGRVTGEPTLLLCTSGTAGAHYYPAVIEASLAHVPLLLLTADRPPELHDAGAAQTIDQSKLFGSFPRRYIELGLPDEQEAAWRGLRRRAAQAVFDSRHPRPGPVHLNAWLRKPLEPQPAGAGDAARRALLDRLREEPAPRPTAPAPSAPGAGELDEVAAAIARRRRGVVLCGPAPLAQGAALPALERFARAARYPVLAEAGSQFRLRGAPAAGAPPAAARCDAFELLLRCESFRARHAPELLFRVGGSPTGDGWRAWLAAHPRCERIALAPYGWSDPENDTGRLMVSDVAATLDALAARLEAMGAPEPGAWESGFARADEAAWRVVRASCAEGDLTPARIVRALAGALPDGALLFLGNSLPIREMDRYVSGAEARAGVLTQRGANGIDGLLSGAAGAASVAGRPVAALVGDMSFLHDLGGLALARGLEVPLLLCVVQNGGGRIFEELPVARQPELAAVVERHLVAPPGLDLGAAARLFGHRHVKAARGAELAGALAEALARPGCTVVEAVAPPAAGAAERRELVRRLDETLARPEGETS